MRFEIGCLESALTHQEHCYISFLSRKLHKIASDENDVKNWTGLSTCWKHLDIGRRNSGNRFFRGSCSFHICGQSITIMDRWANGLAESGSKRPHFRSCSQNASRLHGCWCTSNHCARNNCRLCLYSCQEWKSAKWGINRHHSRHHNAAEHPLDNGHSNLIWRNSLLHIERSRTSYLVEAATISRPMIGSLNA